MPSGVVSSNSGRGRPRVQGPGFRLPLSAPGRARVARRLPWVEVLSVKRFLPDVALPAVARGCTEQRERSHRSGVLLRGRSGRAGPAPGTPSAPLWTPGSVLLAGLSGGGRCVLRASSLEGASFCRGPFSRHERKGDHAFQRKSVPRQICFSRENVSTVKEHKTDSFKMTLASVPLDGGRVHIPDLKNPAVKYRQRGHCWARERL